MYGYTGHEYVFVYACMWLCVWSLSLLLHANTHHKHTIHIIYMYTIHISYTGDAVLVDLGSAIPIPVCVSSRQQALQLEDEAARTCSLPYRPPELLQVLTGSDGVWVCVWVCVHRSVWVWVWNDGVRI
ncbi:hypothetical protein EON63_24430 [archaeon]|nr:MAG: hypothetical protein EON63_24430 [archaeon]